MHTTKPVNLGQLQTELGSAGIPVAFGLTASTSASGDTNVLQVSDGNGMTADLPPSAQPVLDAHVALRDKTDAEYAAEFQNPATTAARKQEIRDITSGLLPREQVPMT